MTYISIAGSGSTPAQCTGSFGSGGATTVTGVTNTIPGFTAPSGSGPTYVATAGRTGWYDIGVTWQIWDNSGTKYTLTISTVRGSITSSPATGTDCGLGIYLHILLQAGDAITLSATSGNPYTFTGTSGFAITYVPTPINHN